MANQAELKLILNAVDNASAKINGVTGSVDRLGKMSRIGGDFVSGLGANFSAMANPAMLAGIAISKVADFTKKAVSETVAYNKEIREMTQVTGLGAEEISRIVQVGDDWGISIGDIRTALQFMNKQGITPSIETLANMADEYVNSTDKAKWANEAVKTLGRGYSTLIPLFAKGGDALREQTDAVNDNLIATEAEIAASREYEVAVDNLGDAWTGFKQTIGNAVIPVLADLLTGINDVNDAIAEEKDVTKTYKEYLAMGLVPVIKSTNAIVDEYGNVIEEATGGTADMKKAVDDAADAYAGAKAGLVPYSDYTDKATGVTEDLTEAIVDLNTEADKYARTQEALNEQLSDLNDLVNGKLGPEMDDFVDTQGDLEQQMKDVQTEIDKAISEGYSPLSEKVLGLKDDYGKLKTQYGENATAHEDATKRILFDILTQEAAVGGLTINEKIYLDKIARQWGLVDSATEAATRKAQGAMDYVNRSGDFEGADAILAGHKNNWTLLKDEAGLARDRVVAYRDTLSSIDGKTVNTYIHEILTQEDYRTGGGRHSRGANFVVPPGYPNDSYPMRVESGEHVTVTPANQTNTTTNTWNIHTNAPYSVYGRNYQMAKAMAG